MISLKKTVSSSSLGTSRCGHLWARIHHDRPFPARQRNILLWWVSLFVPGCICAAEILLLLFDITAHHGRWNHETMEKRQDARSVAFHGSWQMFSKAKVCESGQLPGVKTGISIQLLLSQWGTHRFASAGSKEMMFSLWDHINCSSSNGSFLLLGKCAGSGSLCQGYGRKLCWRWEECSVASIQYTLTSKVQKGHGKCHEKSYDKKKKSSFCRRIQLFANNIRRCLCRGDRKSLKWVGEKKQNRSMQAGWLYLQRRWERN